MKINTLLIDALMLILLMGMTSCKKDSEKKDEAIKEIESYLAEGNYKRARNAVEDIPAKYDEMIREYYNIVNRAELLYLISSGETEDAKDLFVKSCSDQRFFVKNVSHAVGLVDDDFIVNQLSGWQIVDYYGNALTFKDKAINCEPEDYYDDDRNNVKYNEVVTKYNGVIESVVYTAMLSNNLELAQKCMVLYMPLAKEVSRTRQNKYSSGHYDIKYTKDDHFREEAEKSIASLQKIKNIEVKFNGAQFARGSAELNDKSKSVLDELASYMNSHKDVCIKVVGHTSADGSNSTNMALSTERAEAVTSYLVSRGVSSSRLQTEGVGSSQLRDVNNPKSEDNCRTEFRIIK